MKKNPRIFGTLFTILLLTAIFMISFRLFHDFERKMSFERIEDYAKQASEYIKHTFEQDHNYLEQIAGILARTDLTNNEDIGEVLSFQNEHGMISRLELLLPDDTLINSNGETFIVSDKLSFNEAVNEKNGLSRICSDVLFPEKSVLRHYVPIIRDGQTTAVLIGVIDTDSLNETCIPGTYNDDIRLYILEAGTGDYIYNVINKDIRNINELENFKAKRGYSWERYKNEVAEGRESSAVLMLGTTRDYFYTYTVPVGISDWMVTANVIADMNLSEIRTLMYYFYCLAAGMLIVFLVYFAWMIRGIYSDKAESDKQLHCLQCEVDVKKALFDAYLHQEHFKKALDSVAGFLVADSAFFKVEDIQQPDEMRRFWSSGDISSYNVKNDLDDFLTKCMPAFENKEHIICYNLNEIKDKLPEASAWCEGHGINSIMIMYIAGVGGEFKAVLGAVNIKYSWQDDNILEQIKMSFSMAVNQYISYQVISRMGQIDSLTGLQNRNSFDTAVKSLPVENYNSFACTYVDVNGLHELNNALGHSAGDAMLKSVAGALKAVFVNETVYRIGGDEFLVFSWNCDKQELSNKTEKVKSILSKQNYAVSIGTEWRNEQLNIQDIIDASELLMQKDKRKYYVEAGKEHQMRLINRELEKMMLEKQDADTFLSILAPEFKGVYFVDLIRDSVRHLYIPDYFDDMLRESREKFSDAILLYAKQVVKPEYYSKFEALCDYEALKTLLENDILPEFVYQKTDETWLNVKVIKFKNYTHQSRETLWIFTNADKPD